MVVVREDSNGVLENANEVRPAWRTQAESGSILVMAAAGLLVTAIAAALIVDAGRLSLARREGQLQADLAALAASTDVGACRAADSLPNEIALATATANGFVDEVSGASLAVDLGTLRTVDGLREFDISPSAADATAVQVSIVEEQKRSLLAGSLIPGMAELRSVAAARRQAVASFSIGSFLIHATPSDIPIANLIMGALIDGSVSLDVVNYGALSSAHIRMGDLIEAIVDVETIEELRVAEMDLADLLYAAAVTLGADGETIAASSMLELADATSPMRSVRIDDFLVMSNDAAVLYNGEIGALELCLVSAQSAAQAEELLISSLPASIAGTADVALRMAVIEPAQIAIGLPGQDSAGNWRTTAETAQLRIQLDLSMAVNLSFLGTADVELSLYIDAAKSAARLETIGCGSEVDRVHRVSVGVEPGLVTVGLGVFDDPLSNGDASASEITEVSILGVPVIRVTGWAESAWKDDFETLNFVGPFPPTPGVAAEDNLQTVGTDLPDAAANAATGLADSFSLDAEVLGFLPIGLTEAQILAELTAAIEPTLNSTANAVSRVLQVSGVHIGGADVSIEGLFVSPPRLVR